MKIRRRLSEIHPGECCMVEKLENTGDMRRRLLDIGLTENTKIQCLGRSPMGDPSAYLIRGAVIALRRADSQRIMIREVRESQWD